MEGFPDALVQRAHHADLSTLLSGGDEAVYFAAKAAEFLNTVSLPAQSERILLNRYNKKLGCVEADTLNFGRLSLDEFLDTPESFSQGFIVVKNGDIVYEHYPRMDPSDDHVWMSPAKVAASLVIDLLIGDGKIDEERPFGDYVPGFRGTPTAEVRIKDILDMSTGLDVEENYRSIRNPDSIPIRTFLAEFGFPYKGKRESLADVLRSARSLTEPGIAFQYSSATTQLLVLLAEAVEGVPWSEIFGERIWSKLGAEAPIQLHQTPDGVVAAHGLISSTLRDFARFGMLYTPSWSQVASEQVVDGDVVKRIQEGVRSKDFFLGGSSGPGYEQLFGGDSLLSNSRQWDVVWDDGDFWKSGLFGQGLYVSPEKDLVIAYFSMNPTDPSIARFLRPLAYSEWL